MAAEGGAAASIHVLVLYSPEPRVVHECALALPVGSTVADAVRASGLVERFTQIVREPMGVGVWGRKATPAQVLREADRVEIYRRLRVDPKLARRERFARQGARAAGLFAQRRKGAKPGY